jgi:hypothetical protein
MFYPGVNIFMDDLYSEKTQFFDFGEVVIVITPGELYTSYEKILMPFDDMTWLFLIITLFSAFLIIFFVKQLPKSIQNIIFGVNVHHPTYNVVGIFFGMGLHSQSTHNFGRIIMIVFVFFCLIIRTAYQGVQFEMMSKEMRKLPVKNVDELHEKNYTILICEMLTINSYNFVPMMDYLTKYRFGSNSILIYNNEEIGARYDHGVFAIDEKFFDLLVYNFRNSSAKLAFIGWKRELIPITTKLKYKEDYQEYITEITKIVKPFEGRVPLKLQQNILSVPIMFGMTINSFFTPLADKIIPWLLQAGIVQHLRKNELVSEIIEKDELKVLSMLDLSFGFVLWLVACAASTIMYLIHWLMFVINILLTNCIIKINVL